MIKRLRTKVLFMSLLLCAKLAYGQKNIILIEAESFTDKGGWVLDQQAMNQMGSPYLMAHGLGKPVKDATTEINVLKGGEYKVWVRTRDWTAPWKVQNSPGKFQLVINGEPMPMVYGTEGIDWHWQYGGTVELKADINSLALHDLIGFNGRCDAILFSKDTNFTPPSDLNDLERFRKKLRGLGDKPEDVGSFDLVVVGGGMAGCCAAVSAARLGCKVALIQNRPVLGGNNSSEVRVGLSGQIHRPPYPMLGNLVDEIGSLGYWNYEDAKQNPEDPKNKKIIELIKNNPEKTIHNAGPASNYGDDRKRQVVEQEKNITLFLNTQVFEVQKAGDKIVSVTGRNIETGKEYQFKGVLFADCTGDADLGFLANADYRQGTETRDITGEPKAPEKSENLTMGTSVQWYAVKEVEKNIFPDCTWAVQFNDENCHKIIHGEWDWETGMNRDQIKEVEYIRDYGLRAVFGNWSFLKNHSKLKEEFANHKLEWVAYIGGKRESRRLLGDVILQEQDIEFQRKFEDASFTTTWSIDLHYPIKLNGFEGEAYMAESIQNKIKEYAVPYRCLYSRNINNLFMAGRNISVTHVALGTVRVMRTTGMMGEVVGMAASICKKHNTEPRQVYQTYLNELKALMEVGVTRCNN